MKENNKLNVNDVREIGDLISHELRQLKESNSSMKDSIEILESRIKKSADHKNQIDEMDVELLDCSKRVYHLNDERIQELSKLYKKITNVYLMMIKK